MVLGSNKLNRRSSIEDIDMEENVLDEAFKIADSLGSVPDIPSSDANHLHSSPPKKKHSSYGDYLKRRAAGPSAPGSKQIPEGTPNCLLGLTFVFTGELSSLGREDAADLVKKLGGRVTTAPSRKTNFVVVGEMAGEGKLAKVKELGLNCLDEDAFYDLIRTKSVNTAVQDMTIESKKQSPKKVASPVKQSKPIKQQTPTSIPKLDNEISESSLWTVKYAPKNRSELIGNTSIYERLLAWIQNPKREQKAALLSGPPGIGKTTMAHMACTEAGFKILEFNASDCRNKKTLHESVKEILDNTALSTDYFKSKASDHHAKGIQKQILIMDEVDGMSSGDRGGMAELIQLIKKSKIPIICCCNDRSSPKVRSLANYCLDLRLRRPDARQIGSRISSICEKEGLHLQPNVVEQLVASTHGDIRQLLNCLSTFRLTGETQMSSPKDIEEGPFDAVSKLLTGQYDRLSMADKLDAYFIDSSLVPLMIHENYFRSRPTSARSIQGKPVSDHLKLMAAAADSLSLSEKVESLIRGSNQEWSLAPLHGYMSCVLPSYYVHGALSGQIMFPSWFGNNSKATKSNRLLKEISNHTFLALGASTFTIRAVFCEMLTDKVLGPLVRYEPEIAIKNMDEYHLCREDVDSLIELTASQDVWSKIPSAAKSAFTRKYNSTAHKLPYAIGSAVGKSIKVDDLEGDVESVDGGDDANEDVTEDTDSLANDKMIKAKPAKKSIKK